MSGHSYRQLFCPICNRDYELPRRHTIQLGDHDFSPIPRLLSCLHTACQSCLEHQYQNSETRTIECPICHFKEAIFNVEILPLDFSLLKEVVSSNSTELLANCARCYDPVPSISWCETCSSALCEFHHQDHKLSADTSAFHKVATFREYLEAGRHIIYQFPPISCPQCPLQDCSLYCHQCLHLISPKAFIDFHHTASNHPPSAVKDYIDCIDEMEQVCTDSLETSQENCLLLQKKIQEIQGKLKKVDDKEILAIQTIQKQMMYLQSKLKKREKELLERKSLHTMKEVKTFTSSLLEDTKDGNAIEKMYLVQAADTIEYRCDTLSEQMKKMLSEMEGITPVCSVEFLKEDVKVITGLINKLGVVLTDEEEELAAEFDIDLEANTAKEEYLKLEYECQFTVNVKDHERRSVLKERLPSSAQHVQTMIVEARLIPRSVIKALQEQKTRRSSTRDTLRQDDLNEKKMKGILIGQIEISDKIDRQLLGEEMKMKSYFETMKHDYLPVLRIMKEAATGTAMNIDSY